MQIYNTCQLYVSSFSPHIYLLKVQIMNPVFLFLALFGPFFVDPSGALVLLQSLVNELKLTL